MSVIRNVVDILRNEALGVTFEAGKYPESTSQVSGKVVFAGGMGVSEYDKPRNVMGGDVLRAEAFKVVLRGTNYIQLEEILTKAKIALRNAGYHQLSGLEHIEPKEDGLLQLAITFKSTKQ
ncbi:MAG: hypothetical protein FWE22_00735 [Firmicutes bacterium]|nr:hypothetical protein [Bacillota bacterium]